MEFKVGDRVQIREWDDMKREFGAARFSSSSIGCKFTFVSEMRYLCGKEFIIRTIDSSGHIYLYDHPGSWNISKDMIKLASKESRKGVKKVEEEKTLCHSCEEEISDYSYTGADGKQYCEDCFNDRFTYCYECDEVFDKDDLTWIDSDDRYVCEDCLDNKYTKCDDCGNYVRNSRINSYSNINLCNSCNSNYYRCADCGDAVHEDDAHCDEEDDEYYCSYCWSNRPAKVIHDYSHKPSPIFRTTSSDISNPAYFGVELEIDSDRRLDNQEAAERVLEFMDGEDYIYNKTDGSLNYGFEMVTHPFTLDYHMSKKDIYKKVFDYLIREGYRSHDADTCGLHVHVGKKFMGDSDLAQDLTIAKILYVFEKFWDTFVKLSRRTPARLDEWARRYCFADLNELDKNLRYAKGQFSRYHAVNLTNAKTVEFRMFRGTLNVDTFIATIQLLSIIVNRCKELPIEQIQQITFDSLVQSDYEELNSYISKRLNNETYSEIAA